MAVDKKTVGHIAHLARIGITVEEVTRFQKKLSAILAFVEELRSVDTQRVEPIAHVTGRTNAARDDDLKSGKLPGEDHDSFEEQAPGHTDGEIRVPRVLQ